MRSMITLAAALLAWPAVAQPLDRLQQILPQIIPGPGAQDRDRDAYERGRVDQQRDQERRRELDRRQGPRRWTA